MAACKCRFCQAKLTTTIAYKVEIDKNKFYFCNEEHYEKFMLEQKEKKKKQEYEQQLKDKFYNLFCEILGVNGITNTALWKEKAEINKVFSDEVIITYLEENKDWIINSVSRLNGNIYGKIRYVSTILKNKLGDFEPKVNVDVKEPVIIANEVDTGSDVGLRINKKKKKERRKGFAEMEG